MLVTLCSFTPWLNLTLQGFSQMLERSGTNTALQFAVFRHAFLWSMRDWSQVQSTWKMKQNWNPALDTWLICTSSHAEPLTRPFTNEKASFVLDEQEPLIYQFSSTEQGFSLGTLGYISYNTVNIKNSDITDSHLMGWDLVYQGTKYFHYSLITDSKTCCLWYTEGQHTLSRGPSLALLWTVWLLQGQFRRLFLVTIVEVKYFTATVCWHFFY